MKHTPFERVVVIGYGLVTKDVLQTVCDLAPAYGYACTYIQHEVHPFNGAKTVAEAEGIPAMTIQDRQQLTAYLEGLLDRRTLIISASNNYLFPPHLVEHAGATIINFHNALLPDLPGRNAPSWAIFQGREETGITWHYVTAGVDAGDIILQRTCAITPDTKAYQLVAQQMKLAAEGFSACYEDVLRETAPRRKQQIPAGRRLYKSCEIPGDGRFSLSDPPDQIYRLLRALDYGKNDIFPPAQLEQDGEVLQITRYKKVSAGEAEPGPGRIYLPLADDQLLMLKCKPWQPEE